MRALLLAVVLVASRTQPVTLQGVWTGSFQTEHGSVPLELTVAPSDLKATYRMTFLGTEVRGSVSGLKAAGDSLHFAIGFLANVGAIEFQFAGVVKGSEASGTFVGLMDGIERGRGPWSITRER